MVAVYPSLVLLPELGALSAGLRCRALGATGAQLVSTVCLVAKTVLSLVAFYEEALCRSPVTVLLSSWLTTEGLTATWSLLFVDLSVGMLLPVLVVSSCVHVYSGSYMAGDPSTQRFFAFLSLFTASRLVVVTADSSLLLFEGSDSFGLSSFLLISFWTTRLQAGKSAVLDLRLNRVGDRALTACLFALIRLCSYLDYATVLSKAPGLTDTALTVVGLLQLVGAMAQSALLPLHTRLPAALDGCYCKLVSQCGSRVRLHGTELLVGRGQSGVFLSAGVPLLAQQGRPVCNYGGSDGGSDGGNDG